MMRIINNIRELDFPALIQVYERSLVIAGEKNYRHLSEFEQRRKAEEDYYDYLLSCFFRDESNKMFVLENQGRYVCALRLERFNDGYLLTGLETMPSEYRKGFAKELLKAVIAFSQEHNYKILYSHVEKINQASLAVHRAVGFEVADDLAVYLDGTVTRSAYTLRFDI